MFTAVIFDMDGTLFDTEAVFQKYWNAIAKERGIVLPDAFKYEICGTSGEVMNRIIEKQYRVKDGTEIQRECKRRVAEELSRGVPLKPGCREILASLHARGIPMARSPAAGRSLHRFTRAASLWRSGAADGGRRSRAICLSAALRPISLPLRAEMKSFTESRHRIFFCWLRKDWASLRRTATSLRTVRMASVRRTQPA